MSFRKLLVNKLKHQLDFSLKYSVAVPKSKNNAECVISTKRSKLNHYTNTVYDKLEEIPLISKGWNHGKSKGDHFTVHPVKEETVQEMHSLESLNLHSGIRTALNGLSVEKATDFQKRAMKPILDGKHTLLAAETGCGKTLAYLVPIIQSLIDFKQSELNTPRVLVLVPNRELAYQVGEIASCLSEAVGLKTEIVVGGRTKRIMLNPEFGEIDLLVGTPGAIGKLSTVGIYKLNEVKYTVFDEADTLIDDSFVERISGIVKKIPQSQIILVSATLPKKLPDILFPIEAQLQHVTSPKLHKPPLNITQKFLRMTRAAKPSHLLKIVKANKQPMLIFSNRNESCNWLAMFLRENNIPCSNINGDMNYQIRIEQWNQFVKGQTQVLSATDVGSRGLNTIQVNHVLNYSFPVYAADYLHRIGRVGRLGSSNDCKVTNFISGPEEVALVQQIEYAIRKNEPLQNVDGNITNMVQRKILKS